MKPGSHDPISYPIAMIEIGNDDDEKYRESLNNGGDREDERTLSSGEDKKDISHQEDDQNYEDEVKTG